MNFAMFYDKLIQKHSKSGVILDTNVLLLKTVGDFDPLALLKFKRLNAFTKNDYEILVQLLSNFRTLNTTPGILAETSNLLSQVQDNQKQGVFSVFAKDISVLMELSTPSKVLANMHEFSRFGFTDTSMINASQTDHALILTTDLPLAGYLQKLELDVINFNNLRTSNWP